MKFDLQIILFEVQATWMVERTMETYRARQGNGDIQTQRGP